MTTLTWDFSAGSVREEKVRDGATLETSEIMR